MMTTRGIPRASLTENARFTLTYVLPNLLRGPYIGQPFWMRLTARLDTARWAASLVERLQDRYGGRAVLVHGVTGNALLVLSAEDARRVLQSPVDLYAMDTVEKHRGLSVFQPDGVIVSRGALRRQRRPFNEAVLDFGHEPHRLAERFVTVIGEEIPVMLEHAERHSGGVLSPEAFDEGFRRIARRCIFGDAARDDTAVSNALAILRHDGNWMGYKFWVRRRDAQLAARFRARVRRYAEAAEPGSLVSLFQDAPQEPDTQPAGQVAHWMMAFDALRAAIVQTMALMASHRTECDRAVEEITLADAEHGRGTLAGLAKLEYLRSCFWEGARLWPPVPTLMRVTTAETSWYGTKLPAGTGVLIPSMLHHRDHRLPQAHRFAPEIWQDGSAYGNWWLSPFSRGEAACAGRDLGDFLGKATVAELLRQRRFELLDPELSPDRPLPQTINPIGVRFAVRARQAPPPAPRPSQGSESRLDRTAPSDPAVAGG